MPFLSFLGPRSTLSEVFRAFPETSKPLIEFSEALLRGPSPFTAAERELIATYVSRLNQCQYCTAVHCATTERLGIPKETLERLAQDLECAPARMQPVLRYAEKLTRDPSSADKTDVAAILAGGWEEQAVYHAVAITALFNFMNRLVDGLGIELDPGYVPAAAERLAERGYAPHLEMMKK